MSQVVSGTFIADGSTLNIDVGFIPDYVEAFELTSGPEIIYRWYRCLEDEATSGRYGLEDSGAGVITECATAAAGFAAYNGSKNSFVLITDPATDELVPVAVYGEYTTTISSAATARSVTDIGTIIRPSAANHNGYVYECVTAGTGSDEPTWPTTPGDTVLDNDVKFICREENIVKGAGMGFAIGATLSVNSDLWVFKAERHDRMGDLGDAADADPITFS